MKRLGFSEGEFNIAYSQLGTKYLHMLPKLKGDDIEYEISVTNCLELQDQFDEQKRQADQQKRQESRHKWGPWWSLGLVILGAGLGVLGTLLTSWLLGD